jgi:hypothetical protein
MQKRREEHRHKFLIENISRWQHWNADAVDLKKQKNKTNTIIWQLWQNYTWNKDSELLAQAVEAADFGDELNINTDIQKEAAAFIRQHTRNHKFETSVRDNTVRFMHEANKSQGLSSEASYRAIKEKFDEWAKLASEERRRAGEDNHDNIHIALSTEAIRKILN